MPCILHIETSTTVCSVAVSKDGGILYRKENFEGPSHASCLGGFVQDALEFCQAADHKVDAVAVSSGPGSYTGLRIGVSEAKGLCFGLDIPLLAINTLELMTCSVMFKEFYSENALFCPMIDARRMEVYSVILDMGLQPIKPVSADIVDESSYLEILENHVVYFFGNGSPKCQAVITHKNAHFIEDVHPLAVDMLALAEKKFRNEQFEDVAYYEPFYLKEFVATQPKNKILNL